MLDQLSFVPGRLRSRAKPVKARSARLPAEVKTSCPISAHQRLLAVKNSGPPYSRRFAGAPLGADHQEIPGFPRTETAFALILCTGPLILTRHSSLIPHRSLLLFLESHRDSVVQPRVGSAAVNGGRSYPGSTAKNHPQP